MLYLIGIGLGNERSISLEGLEAVKKCKKIFLENYTSRLESKNFEFKFEEVNRNFVENFNVLEAKEKNVALLIIGDVFSATTHIAIFNDCRSKDVEIKVINNASILTAVGITGLELYKFGKVGSIPFDNEKVEGPIKILENNKRINAHTLLLLDLEPEMDRFLSVKNGIEYLERNNIRGKIIGCARLGREDFMIKYGEMSEIKGVDFGEGPYCLIVPSDKLHFMEEEVLRKWELQ